MATQDTIGATAGLVWHFLAHSGRSSLAAVEKGVSAPRAVVDMAIGWLAREGKLTLLEGERSTQIELIEH